MTALARLLRIRRRQHPDPLAAWLTSRRRETGLSQHQIARACGVHRVTVSHWETGRKRPTLARLACWCDALDVSLADIQRALARWGGV